MNQEFGLKELYELTLKATYPIEMQGRIFEPGEVIARFDKIQIANFRELTNRISANGGYQNSTLIIWEDPKEIQLTFTQGIFSKQQFALLSNAKLLNKKTEEPILIPEHFYGESDLDGKIQLKKQNVSSVFVYNAKTGERLVPASIDAAMGEVVISEPFVDVEIDFLYEYTNDYTTMQLGQKLIGGFLSLEGKTRVKDDITGKTRTALLRIPRLKLVSDLSMRLGREASPVVANFSAIGLPPIGARGDRKVMELLFLSDDIDADM